jgi:hypothetical protein
MGQSGALGAGPSLFEVYRNRPHARANTLKWELAAPSAPERGAGPNNRKIDGTKTRL